MVSIRSLNSTLLMTLGFTFRRKVVTFVRARLFVSVAVVALLLDGFLVILSCRAVSTTAPWLYDVNRVSGIEGLSYEGWLEGKDWDWKNWGRDWVCWGWDWGGGWICRAYWDWDWICCGWIEGFWICCCCKGSLSDCVREGSLGRDGDEVLESSIT